MVHRQRGSGNQLVVIAIIIAIILIALLYIVFSNPSNTPETVNGTVSPQQEVQPSALAESQAEAVSEAQATPGSAQENNLSESPTVSEAQATPENGTTPESQIQEIPEQVQENASPEATPAQAQEVAPSETQSSPEQAQENVSARSYTVAEGDTLVSIAREHGKTVTALAEENAMANPHQLSVGQVITIPSQQESSKGPSVENTSSPQSPDREETSRTYTVKPGDTLYSIATRYATTVEAMTDANSLSSSAAVIKGGQKLKLPADAASVPK